MILVAVDPGIRGCGVAVFRDNTLIAAAYVLSASESGHRTHECVQVALAVWAWVRQVLGVPAAGPLPAVWRWLQTTFPKASAWLTALVGVDAQVVTLPDVLVCEWPRMYLMAKQEGDQNDLPPLAGVDGALGMLFLGAQLVSVYPDVWKEGQVPKKIMNDRVWARLRPEEQAVVDRRARGGLDHNMLDAVGIGLHHLGRLARRRSYA